MKNAIKISIYLLLLFLIVFCGGARKHDLFYSESPLLKTNPSGTEEEVLNALSKAETLCRLIVVFDIQEEGAQDYAIGQFVKELIKHKRWNIIRKILNNHFYFPQSSGWVLMSIKVNEENQLLIERRSQHLKEADMLTRQIAKNLLQEKNGVIH